MMELDVARNIHSDMLIVRIDNIMPGICNKAWRLTDRVRHFVNGPDQCVGEMPPEGIYQPYRLDIQNTPTHLVDSNKAIIVPETIVAGEIPGQDEKIPIKVDTQFRRLRRPSCSSGSGRDRWHARSWTDQ